MCSLPQRVAVAFRHLPFKKESSKKHHFLLKTVPSAFPGLSGCFCRKRRAGVRGDPPEPGRRGKPVPQPRRASSSRSDCYFGTKTLHSGRILIVLCLKEEKGERKASFLVLRCGLRTETQFRKRFCLQILVLVWISVKYLACLWGEGS